MLNLGRFVLETCTHFSIRRPWTVIGVGLLLTVLAGYAATSLTVNTSTDDILSAELPFRQAEIAYDQKFPSEDLAVVVIDAPTSDEAETAGRSLVQRLQRQPEFFETVELAGSSPYFDRYGLLFLDPEQIREIGEEIRPARRLLADLGADPSLRGFAGLMGMAAEGVAQSAAPPSLARIISQFATTIAARAEGRPAEMQWHAVFDVGGDLQGTRRLVQIKPVLDNSSLDRAGPALRALDADVSAVRADDPDVTFRVTGEPVLRQQELNDAFSGALYASGLSLVLVSLILTIGVRSGRTIGALLAALLMGAIWTTGLAAVTVGSLNLISVAFMVLFFGLGIDFGTHLSLRYLEAVRTMPFAEALAEAMSHEGPSITLSAICAALAFLSFVPTAYTGLAEFGIISALGMVVALVITFTVLPALLSVMRPQPSPRAIRHIGVAPVINRHYRLILTLAGIVTVAAGLWSTRVEIDTNPLNLQNPNTEAVATYRDLANDPETSPYALNVLAPDMEAASELLPRLMELDEVAGVRWIGMFVPQEQQPRLAALQAVRERLGDSFFAEEEPAAPPTDSELREAFETVQASARAIADTPADAPIDPSITEAGKQLATAVDRFRSEQGTEPAALRALGEALTQQVPAILADLRQKLSVSEPVTFDDIPADLRREWVSPDGELRIRVLPDGNIGTTDQMRAFTEDVESVAPNPAGAPASVTGAGQAILLAFAEAIAYTVIAIGVVVSVVRRRVGDVVLVLAPLAVAALWTVAGSAALDLPFNFANVIVIPLLIGLGVASSIHIVARARESERRSADVLDTSTPLAVLITQLNTVAAFATLAIAKHQGLFSMGVLLGLSIFFVLIVSLIVLPSFMIAIGLRKAAEPATV